jgi:hypothetical protein
MFARVKAKHSDFSVRVFVPQLLRTRETLSSLRQRIGSIIVYFPFFCFSISIFIYIFLVMQNVPHKYITLIIGTLLSPVIIFALLREILLRVLGPAVLIIVLANVQDLEDRISIRTGELDWNLPVPVHALAVLLVERRSENRAVGTSPFRVF